MSTFTVQVEKHDWLNGLNQAEMAARDLHKVARWYIFKPKIQI
jgi:hypothetical protein